MALIQPVEQRANGDLMREMLAFVAERIKEAEVEARTGATSADQAVDIGLRDPLKDGLGDGAREIVLIVRGQKVGRLHDGRGHLRLRKGRG